VWDAFLGEEISDEWWGSRRVVIECHESSKKRKVTSMEIVVDEENKSLDEAFLNSVGRLRYWLRLDDEFEFFVENRAFYLHEVMYPEYGVAVVKAKTHVSTPNPWLYVEVPLDADGDFLFSPVSLRRSAVERLCQSDTDPVKYERHQFVPAEMALNVWCIPTRVKNVGDKVTFSYDSREVQQLFAREHGDWLRRAQELKESIEKWRAIDQKVLDKKLCPGDTSGVSAMNLFLKRGMNAVCLKCTKNSSPPYVVPLDESDEPMVNHIIKLPDGRTDC
jgi:hypothetical protein